MRVESRDIMGQALGSGDLGFGIVLIRTTAALVCALLVVVYAVSGHATPASTLRVAAQAGSLALLSQLVWFDRTGKRLQTVGPVANHGNIELSPDGRQVAVAVMDQARRTRDIWLYNMEGDTRTKFTTSDADENWAIWSRDGRRIVFNSTRNGGRLDLFQSAAVPGSMPDLLLESGMWPVSFAPDGRHILFVTSRRIAGSVDNDVMVLPLVGDRQPFGFARTEDASENWASFSPDGRWVAYSSTESGQPEVYVAPFPPTADGMAGRRRVSPDGGSQARWRRDGREIFYIALDRSLMVTAVNGEGATFDVGEMRRLFEPRFFFLDSHGFDVAADGQRILVNTLIISPATPATVAE
jgi:Tol biopolymer transport system component